jgi:hypothetical protein
MISATEDEPIHGESNNPQLSHLDSGTDKNVSPLHSARLTPDLRETLGH